jgi:excisionase family DNA binding protein
VRIEPVCKRWLSTREAADYLSISPGALRVLVHRRRIPVSRVNGRLKFDVRGLDEWVQNGGISQSEERVS